jgi:NTE family protein
MTKKEELESEEREAADVDSNVDVLAGPAISNPESRNSKPEQGTALCLSGGGYRAMLFHTGALWRLNELGHLPRLDRISSVSGGSIAAGVLACAWPRLRFDHRGIAGNFREIVAEPVCHLASRTIDVPSIIKGISGWGSIANNVAAAYRKYLFGRRTLQALPDRPQFVFNATNLQSRVLWRFSKPYMGDYLVGRAPHPETELAIAVAASSAFPPVLSPVKLKLKPGIFAADSGKLQHPPFTSRIVLTDGGVYDNLGLEAAWKRYQIILVSDGGGEAEVVPKPRTNWISQSLRVLMLLNNQIGSLRKRQVVTSFKMKLRSGAYWGIRSDIRNYGQADALDCPHEETMKIAGTATRLAALSQEQQRRILDWGYAICDASMRAHLLPSAEAPSKSPHGVFVRR